MHSILGRTVLDTPTKVQEWLQPREFAGSVNSFVGTPWEIFRPPPELVFPLYNASSGENGHTVTALPRTARHTDTARGSPFWTNTALGWSSSQPETPMQSLASTTPFCTTSSPPSMPRPEKRLAWATWGRSEATRRPIPGRCGSTPPRSWMGSR